MATLIKLTGMNADTWRGAFYFNADKIVSIDEIVTGGSAIYHEPLTPSGELSATDVMDTPDEIARLAHDSALSSRHTYSS